MEVARNTIQLCPIELSNRIISADNLLHTTLKFSPIGGSYLLHLTLSYQLNNIIAFLTLCAQRLIVSRLFPLGSVFNLCLSWFWICQSLSRFVSLCLNFPRKDKDFSLRFLLEISTDALEKNSTACVALAKRDAMLLSSIGCCVCRPGYSHLHWVNSTCV